MVMATRFLQLSITPVMQTEKRFFQDAGTRVAHRALKSLTTRQAALCP